MADKYHPEHEPGKCVKCDNMRQMNEQNEKIVAHRKRVFGTDHLGREIFQGGGRQPMSRGIYSQSQTGRNIGIDRVPLNKTHTGTRTEHNSGYQSAHDRKISTADRIRKNKMEELMAERTPMKKGFVKKNPFAVRMWR